MAARLQNAERERFHGPHRNACVSPAGCQLAEIIDRNEHAMIQASLLGQPALTALLPLLPEDLIESLALDNLRDGEGNELMRAFGHMVKLEMEFLGFNQIRTINSREIKKSNWPFSHRNSKLAVFRRIENGDSE